MKLSKYGTPFFEVRMLKQAQKGYRPGMYFGKG